MNVDISHQTDSSWNKSSLNRKIRGSTSGTPTNANLHWIDFLPHHLNLKKSKECGFFTSTCACGKSLQCGFSTGIRWSELFTFIEWFIFESVQLGHGHLIFWHSSGKDPGSRAPLAENQGGHVFLTIIPIYLGICFLEFFFRTDPSIKISKRRYFFVPLYATKRAKRSKCLQPSTLIPYYKVSSSNIINMIKDSLW